jgi:hypothetical protein
VVCGEEADKAESNLPVPAVSFTEDALRDDNQMSWVIISSENVIAYLMAKFFTEYAIEVKTETCGLAGYAVGGVDKATGARCFEVIFGAIPNLSRKKLQSRCVSHRRCVPCRRSRQRVSHVSADCHPGGLEVNAGWASARSRPEFCQTGGGSFVFGGSHGRDESVPPELRHEADREHEFRVW